MDPTLLLVAILVLGVGAMLYYFVLKKEKQPTAAQLLGSSAASLDLHAASLNRPLLERLSPAIKKIRKRTPVGWAETIDQRIQSAGMANKWSVEKVIIVKIILGVLGAFLSYYCYASGAKPGLNLPFIGMIVSFPLGFMGIDLNLKSQAQKRSNEIMLSLPDILDQITIGVEAGLGFDSAMARAAKSNTGALAEELTRTLQHVQAGMSRAESLRGLAARNKIPELRQFVSSILQAEQFGIPMAQVLRVQASEQRRKRRQRAEEKAMKLPVKVLFPLVLCILPSLFVVLIGPAALRIKNNKF